MIHKKMSDEEKAFVTRKLEERVSVKWTIVTNGARHPASKPFLCPACHQHSVDEFEVLGYKEDRFHTSAKEYSITKTPTVPTIHVSCPYCGFMLSFNAVTLGICVDEFEVLGYKEDRFHTSAKKYSITKTPTVPTIHVSCPYCGFMLSFNAVTLGICDAETGCLVDGVIGEAHDSKPRTMPVEISCPHCNWTLLADDFEWSDDDAGWSSICPGCGREVEQ